MIEERDGGVPSPLAELRRRPSLTTEPLQRLMARVALPAVASNLLMTVFLAVDAYWIGTRLGATSLAAVTAAIFWVWMGDLGRRDGEHRADGGRGTTARRA